MDKLNKICENIEEGIKNAKQGLAKQKYEELKKKYSGIEQVELEYLDWDDGKASFKIFADADTIDRLTENPRYKWVMPLNNDRDYAFTVEKIE